MALREFKHRKKRNVGIVYELLVRRIGTALVEGDRQAAQAASRIIARYFSTGRPLAEQLSAFEAIASARGLSREGARRVLEDVAAAARRIDERASEAEKGSLIAEVNRAFGRDFFSRRLPEYRLLATVQLFVDRARSMVVSEAHEREALADSLVESMCSPEPADDRHGAEPVDGLVYEMVTKKFRERYGSSLSPNQRVVIRQYVQAIMTEDFGPLSKKLRDDKVRFTRAISEAFSSPEVKEDGVLRERLQEARSRLEATDVSSPTDAAVESMMLFSRLVEEISSDA